MKTMVTKVADFEHPVIPPEVVNSLRLQPGMGISWEQCNNGNSWLISVALPQKKYDARDMIGFARTFRQTRTTAEWMKELREGEEA